MIFLKANAQVAFLETLSFLKLLVPYFFVRKANRQHWSRPAGATYVAQSFLAIDSPIVNFPQAISSLKAKTHQKISCLFVSFRC